MDQASFQLSSNRLELLLQAKAAGHNNGGRAHRLSPPSSSSKRALQHTTIDLQITVFAQAAAR